MDLTLDEFASEVGSTGAVTIVGSGSRLAPQASSRKVRAPSGIERIDPAEMVVECGAGTPVDDVLEALRNHGQTVSIPAGGTIGGALAVGRSPITRLGHGAMRDVLLQARFVSASGQVTKAGGPTVKNVSGFDLCRLLVGSYGTLGFVGDVILRTRPLARRSAWFTTERDPFELLATMYRPVSILWNGLTTWVRLDGDPTDIDLTVERMGLTSVGGPPPSPGPWRWSMAPSALPALRSTPPGTFLAEIGVGIVHHTIEPSRRTPDPAVAALHSRIKQQFDPTGRLNPGISPLTHAAPSVSRTV